MFVPRSRVRIFRNELTRSTPFVPKLTFWCISYHLGCIRDHLLALGNSVENGRTSANVRAMKRVRIFHSERTRSTLFDPKLTFWSILYHLGAFGTVWLPYETRWKTGRTSAKFVPRSRVGFFCNERTRSTPFKPKLMFW